MAKYIFIFIGYLLVSTPFYTSIANRALAASDSYFTRTVDETLWSDALGFNMGSVQPIAQPTWAFDLMKAIGFANLDLNKISLAAINQSLSQQFALKSLASILDYEALLYKQDLTVSAERFNFGLAHIFNQPQRYNFANNQFEVLDIKSPVITKNEIQAQYQRLLDRSLGEWIQRIVKNQANSKQVLSQGLHLPPELWAYYKSSDQYFIDSGLIKLRDQYREQFLHELKLFVSSQGQQPTSWQSYFNLSDLSVDLTKIGLHHPFIDNQEIYFYRLKDLIQNDLNYKLELKFNDEFEPWPSLVISPYDAYGKKILFPQSYQQFLKRLRGELNRLQRYVVRKRVANTWLYLHWKNRDLLNPVLLNAKSFNSNDATVNLLNPKLVGGLNVNFEYEFYNPLGASRMLIDQQVLAKKLNQIYLDYKDELFSQAEPWSTVLELQVLKSDYNFCVKDLKTVFYANLNQKLAEWTTITNQERKNCQLSRGGYLKKLNQARQQLTLEAFNQAVQTVVKKSVTDNETQSQTQPCVNLKTASALKVVTQGASENPDPLNELLAKTSESPASASAKLNNSLNPSNYLFPFVDYYQKDAKRWTWYFFVEQGKKYQNPATVNSELLNILHRQRLSKIMADVILEKVAVRYQFKINGNDFNGLQLNPKLSDPKIWIPEIFNLNDCFEDFKPDLFELVYRQDF